ncbi:unnamed protein product [Ixodes hexagonus]
MRDPPNTLSFVVRWIQERHESTTIFTSALHSFLQPFLLEHGAAVNISDVSKKAVSVVYDGQMRQVLCTVTLGHSATVSEIRTLYGTLARQWCTAGATTEFPSRQLQWLTPNRDRGFKRRWKPSEHDISLDSISFGTFANLSIFAESHTIRTQLPRGFRLKCVFKHDERMLQIYLILRHSCSITEVDVYQLLIPYQNILRLVVDDGDECNDTTDFFLHVQALPLLYGKRFQDRRNSPFFEPPRHAFFNRSLELGCSCHTTLHCRDLGGNSVLKLSFVDRPRAQQVLERLSWRCKRSTELLYSPMETHHVGSRLAEVTERLYATLATHLGFPCCYALHAVFQQGNDMAAQMVLLKKDVFQKFVDDLIQFARDNEGALEQTLFCIRAAIEDCRIINMHSAVPQLFEKLRVTYAPPRIPPNCSLVRRIFVTPSRVLFLPANVHCENRVLRRFDAEYALRVSFRDDHLQQLSHTFMFHPEKQDMMQEIVGTFLWGGVQIGDRVFKLLATSCSQLRDHGVWLYATDSEGNSADSVRHWMGDFTSVPSVCQKMARMGQCFSSTEESVKVPLEGGVMEDIPDIVGEVHPVFGRAFVFSDGIGMISSSLMQKVCKKLEMAKAPSAIQIRYAGYKGMLCVNPTLEGDKLLLRGSMRKFDCSTSDSLEVIRVSAPSTVYLNRPLISILEQLNVPSRIFVSLQQATVLMFTDALVCESTALRVLITSSQVPLPLRRLQRGGFCFTRDPLIRSLLHTVYKGAMDGLRTKTRIMVPENKGRNMLGVLDETNTLQYGQVFVQYTQLDCTSWRGRNEEEDDDTPKIHILTGTVLVTKCPCLDPGDVRKFEAVDVPALHHIRDCIVFPARGPRPHPDEMAGSDLDGDEYIVIWDEDLLFPGVNRAPMEPIDTTSTDLTNGNFVEGMMKFICKYITNDNVGLMSNAHLAWADMPEHGIYSQRCLAIAKKISICLDFVKTGEPASLEPTERPPRYPDFMEKGVFKDTYRSRRVLGHLYRLHRSLEAVVSTNLLHSSTESNSNHMLFEYPGWKDYEELAQKAQAVYGSRMEQILRQYGIKTEGEVITGLINTVSNYNRSKDDKASVEVLVKRQYQDLVKVTREQFFTDVDAACKSLNVSAEAAKLTVPLQMASAWYMVTYTGVWREANCYSFPWSISDVLLLVMREVTTSEPKAAQTPRNVLITKLNAMLGEELSGKPSEELAFEAITKWATKEELIKETTVAGPGTCNSCMATLFRSFVSHSSPLVPEQREPLGGANTQHTSYDPFFDGQLATAGGYVVGFLRYVSSAAVEFPACSRCRLPASQTHTMTMAALRTYSMLALSRDPCHVGLPCDPDVHEPMQDVYEGNPIRVKVSSSFRDVLEVDMDRVIGVLINWSGVQAVNIRCTGRQMRNAYMIVSVVGRDWQRWFLEEILLQPWLEEAVISNDLDRFLQN